MNYIERVSQIQSVPMREARAVSLIDSAREAFRYRNHAAARRLIRLAHRDLARVVRATEFVSADYQFLDRLDDNCQM